MPLALNTVPTATVIADSFFPGHGRVVTLELFHHRFILAETNTHGNAKSSASSRARPLHKVLAELVNNIAFPVDYGVNQRGMQARHVLTGWERDIAEFAWERGALAAIQTSLELAASPAVVESVLDDLCIRSLRSLPGVYVDRESWVPVAQAVIDAVFRLVKAHEGDNDSHEAILDIHKQISNRPLEPYTWHTAVHTAHVDGHGSSFANMLALRATPAGGPSMAQPEFAVLADAIRDALEASEPTVLQPGRWHTPYVRGEDADRPLAPAMSTARVARVSYVNQSGISVLDDDLRLFLRLATASPPHAAPFEQVTRPMTNGNPGRIPNWESLRHWDGLDGLVKQVKDERARIASADPQAAIA